MNFVSKLMRAYFDYAYNPVYDFTIARLNSYRKLQKRCVDKLELKDNDRVLCVGVGTGNEIFHILEVNRNVDIVGVDYSHTALQKAYKKAWALGKEIEGFIMDARRLEFAAGSFDKALCIHVMDFVQEKEGVTNEILRVLKAGGQFVITYPSDKEGPRLGVNLLRDNVRHGISSGKHRIATLLETLARMLVGLIYLPLLLRPKQKFYSRSELEAVISQSNSVDLQIEEYFVYQDFIVYGRKSSEGGKQNAT
ncbi:2-methoxy-6-polyprenyl-1,4-benzoquinol methylase [subsurface metagenome]